MESDPALTAFRLMWADETHIIDEIEFASSKQQADEKHSYDIDGDDFFIFFI